MVNQTWILVAIVVVSLGLVTLLVRAFSDRDTFIADDDGHPLYVNDQSYVAEVVYHDLQLPIVRPGDPYISNLKESS